MQTHSGNDLDDENPATSESTATQNCGHHRVLETWLHSCQASLGPRPVKFSYSGQYRRPLPSTTGTFAANLAL
jgi:hypothetical protein